MQNIKIPEIEIVYKTNSKPSLLPKISSSKDAFKIIKELFNENTLEMREEFKMLILNNANRVIGFVNLSTGTMTSAVLDLKLIAAIACKALSSGIILCHNHPSGNEKPSDKDIVLTKKVKEVLLLLEINLLDHIIITPEEQIYYSFSDECNL